MPPQRLYQRIYQIKLLLKTIFTGKKPRDDFDWNLYTQHYRGELKEVEENHTTILKPGDYFFEKGFLVKKNQIRPLHVNHFAIYETILSLQPRSVLEVGCGGGDHLHNLKTIRPALNLFGEDLSDKQIGLLKKRHPELGITVKSHDITSSILLDWPPIDIVYTQAVIMHIKTGNKHLTALTNLFKMAKKQVILMENWYDHDFIKDINFLKQQGKISWPTLYLYARPYPDTSKPHLLIASAMPLKGYSEISQDDEMRQG
jgi:SAM-dependent methyltransferase